MKELACGEYIPAAFTTRQEMRWERIRVKVHDALSLIPVRLISCLVVKAAGENPPSASPFIVLLQFHLLLPPTLAARATAPPLRPSESDGGEG